AARLGVLSWLARGPRAPSHGGTPPLWICCAAGSTVLSWIYQRIRTTGARQLRCWVYNAALHCSFSEGLRQPSALNAAAQPTRPLMAGSLACQLPVSAGRLPWEKIGRAHV